VSNFRKSRRTLTSTAATSRRKFLVATTASVGALVIGTNINFPGMSDAAPIGADDANAFIKIGLDNTVTVIIKHLDMGQGVTTGLTTIVADELDADWVQMRYEFATADSRYYNLSFSTLLLKVQGTGGSTSLANSWNQLRNAGALARAMLVHSAAEIWNAPKSEITINKGVITHARSGRSASFGDIVKVSGKLPKLITAGPKPPKDWIYIGKRTSRIDSVEKTTGSARYAMDVKRPRMLTAVVARPPKFGSKLRSFDASSAKTVPGVVDVVAIPAAGARSDMTSWGRILGQFGSRAQDTWSAISPGVAVLAEDTWSAIKARQALKVEWDFSHAERRSTEAIFQEYRALAARPLLRSDVSRALSRAQKTVEAEFTFPYLAHAPMEPLNAVLEMKPDGRVEVSAGTQFQTIEKWMIALALGKSVDHIKLNTVCAGGSFGRRATPNADYINELAHIARASQTDRPVHLVWTREDDIRGGRYRPMVLHRIRAGLDEAGKPVAWEHRIVSQSFITGTLLEDRIPKAVVDSMANEGLRGMPYAIPVSAFDWQKVSSPVPTLWWRSVSHTHTAHAVEVMIDVLAEAAGRDPFEFRIGLLANRPRHQEVLKLASLKGGFGEKLQSGRGRGIALHESFKTIVAMVADVTIGRNGSIKVDKVVAAVDCGITVNPDVARAQIEGAIGFGLGAALRNKITLRDGEVEQSNFHDYEPLRISDMPDVEVHFIESKEDPTGIGEPGVPPVAPAVANAIFAATGKRLHSLPWGTSVPPTI
jgi:isoquinoline 1-oxidoreductase beta subunit